MASFQSFQVEPLTEKFVCYAKLPAELLQYLAGRKSGDKSSITIKFDAQQNVFCVDDNTYTFKSNDQPDPKLYECFVQDDTSQKWSKIGNVSKKLIFDQELKEDDRIKIKKRHEEAEAQRKEHTAVRLEENDNMTGVKTKTTKITKVVNKKPKYVDMSTVESAPKQKLTVTPSIPVSRTAADPEVANPKFARKQLIQRLAIGPRTTGKLWELCKHDFIQQQDMLTIIGEIATVKKSYWSLKPDVLAEVDLDWEGYTEEDRAKAQNTLRRNQVLRESNNSSDTNSNVVYSSQDESSQGESGLSRHSQKDEVVQIIEKKEKKTGNCKYGCG